MSNRKTLKDLRNATFSQASAAGLTHLGWLDGQMTDPSGVEAALVSHSASLEKAKDLMIPATSGQLSDGLLHTPDLQLSLESKLHLRLGENGSQEYELTWRRWDMLSGVPICALRASVRRISGKDSGGWGSPQASDWKDKRSDTWTKNLSNDALTAEESEEDEEEAQVQGWVSPKASDSKCPGKSRDVHLNHQAADAGELGNPAGWKTPHASDGEGGEMEIRPGTTGHYKLRDTAHLAEPDKAGWGTPTVTDSIKGGEVSPRPGAMGLSETAPLAGWPTPKHRDDQMDRRSDESIEKWKNRPESGSELAVEARMAGWPTPNTMDKRDDVREESEKSDAAKQGGCSNLREKAHLVEPEIAGWPTANARDVKGKSGAGRQERKGNPGDTLANAAEMAGWPTPRAAESNESTETQQAREARGVHASKNLDSVAQQLAGWPTPNCDDPNNATRDSGKFQSLTRTAQTAEPPAEDRAGWATPDCQNHRDGTNLRKESRESLEHGANHGMSLHHQVENLAEPGGEPAGWPTPVAGEAHLSSSEEVAKQRLSEGKVNLSRLVESGVMDQEPEKAGWMTPSARTNTEMSDAAEKELNRDHKGGIPGLTSQVHLAEEPKAGWMTPSVEDDGRAGSLKDYEKYTKEGQTSGCRLRAQVHAAEPEEQDKAGWATPAAHTAGVSEETLRKGMDDQRRYGKQRVQMDLNRQAHIADPMGENPSGWPTATSRDWRDSPGMSTEGVNPDGSKRNRLDTLARVATLTGTSQSGTSAETEKSDESPQSGLQPLPKPLTPQAKKNLRLNPAFSLWLMGYPKEWLTSGSRAMSKSKLIQKVIRTWRSGQKKAKK